MNVVFIMTDSRGRDTRARHPVRARLPGGAEGVASDALHDWILAEMECIRDPVRCYNWSGRAWRLVDGMGEYSMSRHIAFVWQGERICLCKRCLARPDEYSNPFRRDAL